MKIINETKIKGIEVNKDDKVDKYNKSDKGKIYVIEVKATKVIRWQMLKVDKWEKLTIVKFEKSDKWLKCKVIKVIMW